MTTKEEFEKRIEEARKIENASQKACALASIASEMADAGMDVSPLFGEAQKTAERIAREDRRVYITIDILNRQVAAELFQDAITTAYVMDVSVERTNAIFRIARASVEALSKLQKARDGELQKPDFKKPTPGQPSAEKVKGAR